MTYQATPLPVVPAFHVDTDLSSSCSPLIQFPANVLGTQQRMAQKKPEVPSSHLWTNLAMAIAVIWVMNQQIDLSFSLSQSLCMYVCMYVYLSIYLDRYNSDFQVNQNTSFKKSSLWAWALYNSMLSHHLGCQHPPWKHLARLDSFCFQFSFLVMCLRGRNDPQVINPLPSTWRPERNSCLLAQP